MADTGIPKGYTILNIGGKWYAVPPDAVVVHKERKGVTARVNAGGVNSMSDDYVFPDGVVPAGAVRLVEDPASGWRPAEPENAVSGPSDARKATAGAGVNTPASKLVSPTAPVAAADPAASAATPAAAPAAQATATPPSVSAGGTATSGGTSAPAGATATATPAAATVATTTTATGEPTLKGIPEGAELWDVGGRVFVVRKVDFGDGRVPVAVGWHVETIEDLEAILGPTTNRVKIKKVTPEEWQRVGGQNLGDSDQIANLDGDEVDELLVEQLNKQAVINPWLSDEKILRLHIEAYFEGRKVTEAELKTTNYWRTHSESERAAILLQASDPASYNQRRKDNVTAVRDLFIDKGQLDPDESLVAYLADQFTTGKMSEEALKDAIVRSTDPYAPGASAFAGRTLSPTQSVVRDDTGSYIVDSETGGRWKLTDETAIARFSDEAKLAAPTGEALRVGGRVFVRIGDKSYEATGPGQVAKAARLYGQPREATIDEVGPVAGNAIGLFRQIAADPASRMEDFASPLTGQQMGNADELFVGQAPPTGTALGYEGVVRGLVKRYLGPYFGQHYGDEFVAFWAGEFRKNTEVANEQLKDKLQHAFAVAFPAFQGTDMTYEDVAGVIKAEAATYYGSQQVPETDAWFLKALQTTDPQERIKHFRKEGLKRGWEPVVTEFMEGAGAGTGLRSVRRPLEV